MCVNCVVYAVIALFVFAASMALNECLTTLFHHLPISDHYKSVCHRSLIIVTRNKSNASFEALQYWQDLLPITRREHTSLPIHVVQKITVIPVQKI